MTPCQNCGKQNSAGTNFCRFCGTRYVFQEAPATDHPYDHPAPRPYAWKTDEFQTQNEARSTGSVQHQPTGAFMPPQQAYQPAQLASHHAGPLAARPNYAVDGNYHCPRCGSSYLPVFDRRVSTAGWIVFSVLLVTTLIFFWIGLLLKEDVAICPVCRSRVS